MEVLVSVIVIAALLLILGVSIDVMTMAIMAIILLAAGAMLIFFAAATVFLIISKRENAEFVGIEKPRGYDAAVYRLSDGEQLNDLFPAERAMRSFVYKKKFRRVSVCRFKNFRFVIDGHSRLTILLGLLLSSLSFAGVLSQTLNFFAEEGLLK